MAVAKLKEIFQPTERELGYNDLQRIERIRNKAMSLAEEFYPADGRHKSLALTHLETACMYAVKGVTHGDS